MRGSLWLTVFLACLVAVVVPATALAQSMDMAPAGARVGIAQPLNGATVSSPVTVVMTTVYIQVKPAGEVVSGTGHHHLVIDDVPPPFGEAVSKDATHLHFGKGQKEATLDLAPGIHTITAQFADGLHRSYGPQLAHTIVIRVR